MRPIPGTVTDPRLHKLLAKPQPEPASGGPTGRELLDLAIALARVAHHGQSRKGTGEPYFNHLERVARRVAGWRAQTIAFLHDTIEDTKLWGADLERMGFPWDIVRDVLALSRTEHETYREFIERTIRDGSDDALRVKLADLQDNLSDPWVSETKLAERYIPAQQTVLAELNRRANPAAAKAA